MNMRSDLEIMVEHDMFVNGYDPTNKDHIKLYWEMMLDGN